MTFGGMASPPRAGGQTGVVELPAPPDVSDASAPAGEIVFTVADGAAGLLLWRLERSSLHAVECALGVDSRRAARLPLPDGRRALCLAVRPSAPSTTSAPMLAVGCEQGTLMLLSLGPSSNWEAAAEGGARASAASERVVRVAASASHALTESVAQLAWSTDGMWLYAAVGRSVCCLNMSLP